MRHVSWMIAAALCVTAGPVSARSLRVMQSTGTLGVCAHPNSLPFASKTAQPPGFQIELGRALAERMQLHFVPDWILTGVQIPRADCDVMFDVIADPEAQGETRLKLSRPYYGNGVTLVVPADSPIDGFAALNGDTKVGVAVGSVAAETLSKRGVAISIFGFEEDMINATASGEVKAAVVAPIFASWYLHGHPDLHLKLLQVQDSDPRLHWNMAVGMRGMDPPAREAVQTALDSLIADGSVARIYAGYGITLTPPH